MLSHAFLPAMALLITTIGTWILTMRNTMITTLAEDYVRMARAKGLPGRRIMVDYAARNAILPNLTGFAMSLGFVVSGAILIEYVFNYPGVGYMLLQAVQGEDYPLEAGPVPAHHGRGAGGHPARRHRHRAARPAHQDGGLAMSMPISGVPTAPDATGQLPEPGPARHRAGPRPATRWPGWAARSGRNRKATAGTVLLLIFSCSRAVPRADRARQPERRRTTRRSWACPPPTCSAPPRYGQDMLAQLVWGTRNVMIIAFVVGLAATGIAVLIGVAAAYLGGLWDGSLSLLTDVLLVIPLFPLLIIIAGYAHGGGTLVLILVITVTSWSYTARQLRSQALSLRRRDYLEAARVRGERRLYIIVVEVIPTMTSLIVASFLTNALYAVLFASSLQFIGLGDPNTQSWGTMLYWAQNNAALQTGQPMWALAPGACIAALGAAFALLNYAFDEIGNPALRPVRRKRVTRA